MHKTALIYLRARFDINLCATLWCGDIICVVGQTACGVCAFSITVALQVIIACMCNLADAWALDREFGHIHGPFESLDWRLLMG